MSFRTASEKSRPSRRTLLLAGGAALTGLAGTGIIVSAKSDEKTAEKDFGTRVGEFNIARSKEFLKPSALYNKTGPQSFAFDDENRLIYTLQLIQGGIELPGERGALTTGSRRQYGDMCVTRLDFDGKIRGHMYLRGFGHGISLGVEPSGRRTHLWIEGDADDETGYGRTVTRVPFRDGEVLDSTDDGVRHQEPLPGARATHPAVDLESRRVLVSFREGPERRYAVYPMDKFRKGGHGPEHELADVWQRDGESFQGCALYGDHIYQLTGSPYTDDEGENPPSGGGNTYVAAINVQTGERAGRQLVTAAPDLEFREPEGIAVTLSGGRPQLCVGFSVKSGDRRKLTVYRFTP
ncbi:phage baseplate protein [Streptomyces bambusae]